MFQNWRIRRLIRKLDARWPKGDPRDDLREIGPAAVPALIDALQTRRTERIAHGVAQVLGWIGDRRAVDALLKALRHPDAETRRLSAEALGNIGDARAVDALIAVLRDANEGKVVMDSAVYGLGKIGTDRAVDGLVAALAIEQTRWNAAFTLGRVNNPRIVEFLNSILAGPVSVTQQFALRVLAEYNIPSSIGEKPVLANYNAIPTVIAALSHKNADVRVESAEQLIKLSLGEADIARAAPALINNVADPNQQVSAAAVAALSKFDKLADVRIADLLAAMVHKDHPSAQKAFFALRTVLRSSIGEVPSPVLRLIAKLQEIDIVVGYYEAACTSWHPVISDEPIYGPMGVSDLVQSARQELIRRGEQA